MQHDHDPGEPETVLARARAARYEAERLAEIALHTHIEALITRGRRAAVQVSPVVEARLYLGLEKIEALGR